MGLLYLRYSEIGRQLFASLTFKFPRSATQIDHRDSRHGEFVLEILKYNPTHVVSFASQRMSVPKHGKLRTASIPPSDGGSRVGTQPLKAGYLTKQGEVRLLIH